MAEKKTERSFEEALKRLEDIVRSMESGTAPLDESLSLFEEGVRLVKFCTEALDHAEQKVKILQKGDDGAVTEAGFAGAVDSGT